MKYRVGVGLNIFGSPPTGRAVFDTFAVFLRVLAFYIDNQPDKDSPHNTDKQIHTGKARKRICKGSGKAVCKGKHLAGQVSPRRKAYRLPDFIKEIHKEQIGNVGKQQLFPVDSVHLAIPLSLFFTLSRCAFRAAAFSLRETISLRIEGFCSCVSFFAENSLKAAVSASASRPLKNTR